MLANDIKKGARVQLQNGWYGTMADNAKGNIRMVDVEGFCREIGSVYTHDIRRVLLPDGTWDAVTLSPRQVKQVAAIKAMAAKYGM